MADAMDSKSIDRKVMRVRLSPRAPNLFSKKAADEGCHTTINKNSWARRRVLDSEECHHSGKHYPYDQHSNDRTQNWILKNFAWHSFSFL